MPFACPQCHQKCKSLSGLRRHENSAHRDHPGLSIPVTELRRTYHPSLSGMYTTLPTLLSTHSSQACAVISTAILSPPTFHQKPQPPRRATIGPLLHRGPGSNSQSSCTPMPSFLGEGLTTSSSCGQPRSFPMAALRPSSTTEISIVRSMRSRLEMLSGSTLASSTMALSPRRPVRRNGRQRGTTSGTGTLARLSRTFLLVRTLRATSIMRPIRNSTASGGNTAT